MRFTTCVVVLLVVCGASAVSRAADEPQRPSSDQIIGQMILRNLQRQLLLGQYGGMRLYVLENERLRKRAEMLVRVTVGSDGSKHFAIVSEQGWEAANKHVLRKMLTSEEETSEPELRERTQLNFDNYAFSMVDTETIAGRPAYVLEVSPKRRDKYLFRGRIWVDAEDFALVQAEGEPAKNPSFWTKHIQFTQHYTKTGEFWFAARTQSVTEALIFGMTDVTISYFGYGSEPGASESTAIQAVTMQGP